MKIFATIVLLHLLNIVTPLPVDKDGQQKQHFPYHDNGANQAGNAIKAENALHGDDSSSDQSLLSKHVRVARGTHGCVNTNVDRVVVTCGGKLITTLPVRKEVTHVITAMPGPLCEAIKVWCADTGKIWSQVANVNRSRHCQEPMTLYIPNINCN
ncbi:hypothetical protein OS493_021870 [Desmophyllum pertusum]|uniref:Secreted protein n=1 Tax=Desmophyllum pertusum TaxID=174260 RepID=A0A9W9ZN59_9CNID|nr:hypothetical protein OS493_021870 [Desmophyllum pertusum]